MPKLSPNEDCPCDSGKKYKKCCRVYHENKKYPPTPVDLVRARFSAYGLGIVDFIMKTTHPESTSFNAKTNRWQAELEAYCLRNFFMELEILSAEDDKVSYRAKILRFGTEAYEYIEHSTFQQVNGKWLYFGGEMEDVEPEAEESDETATSTADTEEA